MNEPNRLASIVHDMPPIDLYLMCETDAAVPLLLDAVAQRTTAPIIPHG
jgi:hypothetical protein